MIPEGWNVLSLGEAIKTIYGTIQIATQTYQRADGTHFQHVLDPSLDSSGTTPLLLEQLIDLSARMPFAEGSELEKRWHVNICPAELERLTAPVATALQTAVESKLKHLAL